VSASSQGFGRLGSAAFPGNVGRRVCVVGCGPLSSRPLPNARRPHGPRPTM
jgi:hypothetical protein